ncbi:MAG: DUF4493 domain-containing protein [Parabacteroides sp.]|nr:DUF4493 domain-containing protein [Parabacteroides sp.]
MNSFIYRHIHLWLSFLLLFTSCVQEELRQIPNEGEGILRLGITSKMTELSSPQTKATLTLPGEMIIEITGDEGVQTEIIAMDGTSVNMGITLKTGNYAVRAYCGTNNLVQTTPYFESESKSVTIQPLQSTDVILTATVKNAWIVPVVNDNLKSHYKSWAVNLTVEETLYPLISNENESLNGLFVQAGKSVALTFDGENILGEPKSTSLSTIQTEAAKKYVINCNPDVPQFAMDITANAVHTKDGNGNLNGTDVTFNVNTFEGLASLVQSWKVEVLYNETVIRRYESTSAPVAGNIYTMNVMDGWPYLPQGSTLSASLILKTGEVVTPTLSFNLPKPTFGVTLSAYTSYDKYAGTNGIAKNVTDANNCNAETLYGISGGFTGLSLDLVDNLNYGTKEFAITLDGSDLGRFTGTSFGVNSVSLDNQIGLSWGSHTLKATMTFDGITVSKTNTHHITGLPYKAEPPRNIGDHPWTEDQYNETISKFNWNEDELVFYSDNLSGKYLIVGSPMFHLPLDIPINLVFASHRCKHAGLTYEVEANIHDGKNSATVTIPKNQSDYKDYVVNTLTLYTNVRKIRIENAKHSAYRKLAIKHVTMTYR